MFGRYTDQCKRAVFFAQQIALRGDAAAIDPNHLLLGLLIENRAGTRDIFCLRELLPEDAARQDIIARQPVLKTKIIPLSNDGKRVVAYTAGEANRLRDYWIDTEHLVLGLLRDENNAAAAKLRGVGLELKTCRQRVVGNRYSRLPRPNPVIWWVRQRSLGVVLPVVFLLGIIVGLYLLEFGAR
jgi:ATP-dependent Clp protease ATP-binding subunit ClpC